MLRRQSEPGLESLLRPGAARCRRAAAINRYIGRRMIKAAAAQNLPGEHVGAPVYYALKWLLIAAIAAAILL
ncbi:MAG: hypothetical protein ACREUC_23415 [Steroidobacteraceae bacterium]